MCDRVDFAIRDIAGGNVSAFAGAEECGGGMVSKERVSCLLFTRQTEDGFDVQISQCDIWAGHEIRKTRYISICVYTYGLWSVSIDSIGLTGGELLDEGMAVEVEVGLAFRDDYVAAGGQKVL